MRITKRPAAATSANATAADAPSAWCALGRRAFAVWSLLAVAGGRAQARALLGPAASSWPGDTMAPGPMQGLAPAPSPMRAQSLAHMPYAVPGAPPPELAWLRREAHVGAHDQAPTLAVLDVDTRTPKYAEIARFVGDTGDVPRLARDLTGKVLLIYGSSADADTIRLGSSNPNAPHDEVAPLTLQDLARWTPQLATQAGAMGCVLEARFPGAPFRVGNFTYWGTYRDAERNVTCTLLADAENVTSVRDTSSLADEFDVSVFSAVWAAATGAPSRAVEPPVLSADAQRLDVARASVAELAGYLRNRSAPALGYDTGGRAHFVQAAGAGQVNITRLASAGPYTPTSLHDFAATFNLLDSARAGNNTLLYADQPAGDIRARDVMRLRDVHSADGSVVIEVGDGVTGANLSLAAFRDTFGEAGMHALQAGVASAKGWLTTDDVATPANASLWPVHPSIAMVRQRLSGDAYPRMVAGQRQPLLAVLAAQLHANPAYAYDMIRRSEDGTPWHSDARFFDPQGASFRPFAVTVKNELPRLPGGAVRGSTCADGIETIAVPMLQKAFEVANAQRHLLSERAGPGAPESGDVGLVMQMLTGNAPRVRPTWFLQREEMQQVLAYANDGTMVLLTTPPSHGPGPFCTQMPDLVESQAYVVLNSTTDAQNRTSVSLFNPLQRDDAPPRVMNGSLTLQLDDIFRGFRVLFVGTAGA